ncbi:capsule polysaccharide biosynthesis protein [Xylariaceae sp. AK1471]|nr:capsule polysaccharide biosynthesis protein [Xylariaceae sp. AK1471]
MASSAGSLSRFTKIAGPALLPAIAYGAYNFRKGAAGAIEAFFTGPGRTSRIIALVVVLVNWKSLPLAWTYRIFNGMVSHLLVRPFATHTPDKLFQPVKTSSHVTLLEVDYNIHKSNSTYFADLDVSRTHLVGHMLARGCHALANNATTKLVTDPSDPTGTKPARGKFNVILGSVQCSFRKELGPYQRYEMWSRVLSWDRKWMYIVTHFVEKGAVKPGAKPEEWEKKIHASAVSKYVFKVGRLTVHPAILLEASGMLPERPGGWVGNENGTPEVTNGHASNGHALNGHAVEPDSAEPAAWDWKRTEEERRKGFEYAKHLASLDGLLSQFDSGEDGALATFGPG